MVFSNEILQTVKISVCVTPPVVMLALLTLEDSSVVVGSFLKVIFTSCDVLATEGKLA